MTSIPISNGFKWKALGLWELCFWHLNKGLDEWHHSVCSGLLMYYCRLMYDQIQWQTIGKKKVNKYTNRFQLGICQLSKCCLRRYWSWSKKCIGQTKYLAFSRENKGANGPGRYHHFLPSNQAFVPEKCNAHIKFTQCSHWKLEWK